MGHELTSNGLRPDRRKVAAIEDMPPPADKPALMRLLGMATYLARYVNNFSAVTEKLRDLLRCDVQYIWDDHVHGKAFRQLKHMLCNAPVLRYYDVTKPVCLQVDSSQGGIGAVILQDGHPVEYASRAMTPTEKDSYAQIEKECLAVTFGLSRFHSYVYAKDDVVVETDHKPLLAIVKKQFANAPKRLQRMLLHLQRYNFTLVYRPGSQMFVADTLSRAFLPGNGTTELSHEEIAAADAEQSQAMRMVASQMTIDYIKQAATNDEQY